METEDAIQEATQLVVTACFCEMPTWHGKFSQQTRKWKEREK